LDAVTRLLPGALGNGASSQNESFGGRQPQHRAPASASEAGARAPAKVGTASADRGAGMLLDYPHYTRPAEFRGWSVPEVLIGGNHAEVAKWRGGGGAGKTRGGPPGFAVLAA